jgi:hypothetical protein
MYKKSAPFKDLQRSGGKADFHTFFPGKISGKMGKMYEKLARTFRSRISGKKLST